MSTENQWLNVQDVAELLQIKDETVRRWIRRRELPVLELGGPRAGYRIRREDLDHFIWQRYRSQDHPDAVLGTPHEPPVAGRQTDDDGAGSSISRPFPSSAFAARDDAIAGKSGDYLSLMRRIPGITYISTIESEDRELARRRIVFVSREFEVLLGEQAGSLRESDDTWWNRVHPDDRERVESARRASCQSGERLSVEYRVRDHAGRDAWVRDEAVLGDDSGDGEPVWQGIILNVTDRKVIEHALESRMKQHAVVAELSEHALSEPNLGHLFDEAVGFVGQSLNADFTSVMELLPGGSSLRVCAAIGWPNDAKTRAPLSASATSHAQYTLQSKDPVIINDVRTDARFSMSETLRDHGIRSGISVTIPGHGKPWGVLDAHSTQVGAFSVNDLGFLYSVANVLATAIRSSPANQPGAKWLSIRDVSDILRVKDETVRRWIRRGELPIIDLGSSRAGYRVHPSDLDYFIQERYMKP